jgi:hypothetical protein
MGLPLMKTPEEAGADRAAAAGAGALHGRGLAVDEHVGGAFHHNAAATGRVASAGRLLAFTTTLALPEVMVEGHGALPP